MLTRGDLPKPNERDRATILPASQYGPNQSVWVFRQRDWRPGVALFGSQHAVSVRYRCSPGHGTVVDTVLPVDLAVRTELDPYLDPRRDEVGPAERTSPGPLDWQVRDAAG